LPAVYENVTVKKQLEFKVSFPSGCNFLATDCCCWSPVRRRQGQLRVTASEEPFCSILSPSCYARDCPTQLTSWSAQQWFVQGQNCRAEDTWGKLALVPGCRTERSPVWPACRRGGLPCDTGGTEL